VTLFACSRDRSREAGVSQSASLIGTWRAAEFINPRGDDSASRYPLGRALRGYLIYDNTGHVFFQLVRGIGIVPELRGRWSQADSATLHALLADATAYFGTYQADYSSGRVVHRIEGEIPPNLGTTEVATPFRIHADTLQLGRDSTLHWIFLRLRPFAPKLPSNDR